MADCCCSGSCTGHIPLEKVIAECDRLFNQEKKQELGEHLRFWRRRASEMGDKKSELSLLSEMMGHYRMVRDEAKALAAVRDGTALISELGISDTVSAGTILINAATAMQSFGYAEESSVYYKQAESCYLKNLPPQDIRFAALYNNMASSYIDQGNFEQAENFYLQAAEILKKSGHLMDLAVTFINLAQLYDGFDPQNSKIEVFIDQARGCFENDAVPRDGYYAHTCRKCASAFGYFGRLADEKELQERAENFYAGH